MIQNKINNLVFIAIFLLYNKMLSCYKKVKMVLGMKFQYKTKSKRCNRDMQNMIVGRHYCYKGKGIYSGTCSMKYGHFPNFMQFNSLLLPDFSRILKKKRVNSILLLLFYILCSNIIVRGFLH